VRALRRLLEEALRSGRSFRSMRPGSSAGGRWPGETLRPLDARVAPPLVGPVESKDQHGVCR
jgi:hypothetical protein